MNNWDFNADDYQVFHDEWQEEYEIESFTSLDEIDKNYFDKLDERYVWTAHGTCEDQMVTNGYFKFEGGICGCWQTYGYYLAKKPWEGSAGEIAINESKSFECDDCSGAGNECGMCDGNGHTTKYFD